MSDPTQKDHLYQAHPPPKANTLKLDFFFFPELSSTTNSSFLWLRERWKLPTLWLLGDKTPACSRTFQQLHTKWRRLLYHTASALLSALCSDCFKILLLTTFPILSSEDLLSHAFCQCFPKKLKQNLQLSKFWNQRLQEQQDYREYHSPVQEDGLAAIFFLFILANFYLLPWNNEIYSDYLECFPTCRKTTGLFGYYICFLFFQYVINFRVLQIIFYLKTKPGSIFFIFYMYLQTCNIISCTEISHIITFLWNKSAVDFS